MAKINTRSPYFLTYVDEDITSAVLDLYIYTGNESLTMDSVMYSLETEAFNGSVSFEISQLISDHLEVTFNGNFGSNVVWLNYQVTKTIGNAVSTAEDVVTLPVFNGYGYFEDGAKPQLSSRVLQSNNTIYAYDNNVFRLAIQQDNLDYVELMFQGNVVGSRANFTTTSDSDDVIRYVSYTSPKKCLSTVNYLFENRDNYLFQDANNYIFDDTLEVDAIKVTYTDASSEIIKIKTISESKHTPYRLTFINKFGALQSVWMFKRSDVSMSVESESYRSFLYNGSSYDTSEHQYKNYNVSARETISLNSGFYTEDYNEVFRQLLLSERVWIDYKQQILPVNIKSKELSFKTQVNDKLIDYKIDFEFAFDKINSVF